MCSPRTILCLLFSVMPAATQLMAKSEPPMRPQVAESYGKLPMSFEANQGQTDQRVKFLARGPGYTLFLTGDSAAILSLHGKDANATLRMNLLGANTQAVVAGANALPGKSNYFVGSDPKQWRTNVPTYASVKYAGVYAGIDLVYHGDQRLLEYDFLVGPGADPQAINLRFQGARKLRVNGEGALVINVAGSEVIEHAPVVYQEIGGHRQTVAGRYVLRGRGRVGFSVAEYDRSQPLVIDPTLAYSTYVGKVFQQWVGGIAVDASGNAYMTATTDAHDFPITPGAFQTTYAGDRYDVVVTKLNAAGSALIYSTYLGGSKDDYTHAIAIDASGNAYLTGWTNSSNFPTTPGAFQTIFGGGFSNAFVTKLNQDGSGVMYSTYLGGSVNEDQGFGIAVDALGSAYVTGRTYSYNFPTTAGAFQTTGGTAFVTKLNYAGSSAVYSTRLGGPWGTGSDSALAIAVDGYGNAYVTGATSSSKFPTTPGAFQTQRGGGPGTAFVTKLNATGSGLVYSTYLGDYSQSNALAVDASGNAYVTGYNAGNFPITPGAFETTDSHTWCVIGFVTKLKAAGSALAYSTYLGGSDDKCDQPAGIAVDPSGNAYVTGLTTSNVFPTTPDALQSTRTGEAFISKLTADGSALDYSTYFGGGGDWAVGIALDGSGNVYVTGSTGSSNFPTTPGAFRTTGGGRVTAGGFSEGDAFIAKLSLGPSGPGPVTTANLTGPLGNNGWYLGPVTVTLSASDATNSVSSTSSSVDNGPYQSYSGPFPISNDGVHQLLFYSVDTAGRQETPGWKPIKIDGTKPLSHVAALPATATSPNFSVRWSGTDATSGIGSFTIYVADNNGPFTPWLSQTTATQAWFAGSIGHTYAFYSIAQDYAGNQEIKTAAETTIQVPQMPGDVNGDGKIDCADIAIVKASFGKRTGQPAFDPRADVNGDGVVDVRDLAIVSQKLITGTSCP